MDNRLYFRISELDDVFKLAPNLRQDDVNECLAQGTTPERALLRGFIYSDECYTLLHKDTIISMFGVNSVNMPKDWGTVWFLGTEETKNFPFAFVKEGLRYLNKWLSTKYKILINAVDCRNTSHISWLKTLGAQFGKEIYINGNRFLQFYIIHKKKEKE